MLVDDFDNAMITVIVNPGETRVIVPILIINDNLLEATEFFNVEFSIGGTDTAGAVIGKPGLAQVIILSEDGMLHFWEFIACPLQIL